MFLNTESDTELVTESVTESVITDLPSYSSRLFYKT